MWERFPFWQFWHQFSLTALISNWYFCYSRLLLSTFKFHVYRLWNHLKLRAWNCIISEVLNCARVREGETGNFPWKQQEFPARDNWRLFSCWMTNQTRGEGLKQQTQKCQQLPPDQIYCKRRQNAIRGMIAFWFRSDAIIHVLITLTNWDDLEMTKLHQKPNLRDCQCEYRALNWRDND